MEGKDCYLKTRMSNENSTSFLGITSSYLYKVSTKSSYVNLGSIYDLLSHLVIPMLIA